MIDLRKEAEKVIDKLLAGTIQQLAVFVTPDGRVKTTKPTTDLFMQAVKKSPNSLVGVYTARHFRQTSQTTFAPRWRRRECTWRAMRVNEHEAVLAQVATAADHVAAAHELLLALQDDLDGRYSDSFAAAFDLVQELQNEITLIFGRVSQGKGH